MKLDDWKYSKSFDRFPDLLVIVEKGTLDSYFNESWRSILGLDPKTLNLKTVGQYVHPEDRDYTMSRTVFDKPDEALVLENRYIAFDGTIKYISWFIMSEQEYAFCMGRDITSLRTALIENEEKSRQLKRIIENIPGMVYRFKLRTDGSSTIEFMSEAGFEMYEASREEVEGDARFILNMVHPEDSNELNEKIKRSAEDLSDFYFRLRFVLRSGKIKWIEARSIPERQEDGSTIWDGLMIDVTEEVEAQFALEQVRAENVHASKMASLGEMAANIGHEVNNPLAIVQGYTEKLLRIVDEPKLDKEQFKILLKKILNAANRISVIIKSLRKLSNRNQSKEMRKVPVGEILSDCLDLCSEKFRLSGIEIRVDCEDSGKLVECVPYQISQVLLNLLNNSYDAIEGTKNPWVHIHCHWSEKNFRIIVTDSGKGILKSIQDRLFTPFFTSKEVGKGTGLGLSISKRIMEAHHGRIYLDSSSQNTKFVMEFPTHQ